MTQEEKLQEAKRLYKTANSDQRYVLESLFPELKESEDERIRGAIIDIIKSQKEQQCHIDSTIYDEMIVWLEKQGEKKVSEYDVVKTIKERIIEHFDNHLIIDKCFSIGGLKDDILKIINEAKFEKQGEKNEIFNVPSREVILSIWYLGNEWKELTKGSISTEYGTQLDYIQKHWHESDYYLREKQGEQKVSYTTTVETGNGGINALVTKELPTNGCNEQKPVNDTDEDIVEAVKDTSILDMVEPKFKVGDIVQYITDSTDRRKIEEVDTLCNMYHTDSSPIMFEIEDEWKVVVNTEDVEQKPAWGKEDSFRTETLISVIKSGGSIRPELRNEFVNWLKSLKERIGG